MSTRIFIFLALSLFSWPTFSLQQIDSLRLNCQNQVLATIDFEDLQWMFRERVAFENQDTRLINLHFFIQEGSGKTQSRSYHLGDSLKTNEHLLALSNLTDQPSFVWGKLLSADIQKFSSLKDSLIQVFKPKGYRARLLQGERGLSSQLDLLNRGRSKTALSLHNFNLAVDVGIYRRGRYLRRSALYAKLGSLAKNLGAFWGGDFVGFPDAGHIQAFSNGAELLRKFPELTFEYIRFREIYEQNYWKALAQGQGNLVGDTRQLLVELNKNRVQRICACSQAIPIPNGLSSDWFNQFNESESAYVYVQKQAGWVYIKSGDSGYFYQVGRYTF